MATVSIAKRNAPWQIANGIFFITLLIGGWFYYPLGYFLKCSYCVETCPKRALTFDRKAA